jgi:hypothetical protein
MDPDRGERKGLEGEEKGGGRMRKALNMKLHHWWLWEVPQLNISKDDILGLYVGTVTGTLPARELAYICFAVERFADI